MDNNEKEVILLSYVQSSSMSNVETNRDYPEMWHHNNCKKTFRVLCET